MGGTGVPEERWSAAHRKCYTHYRHLLSELNHRLETTQIDQY